MHMINIYIYMYVIFIFFCDKNNKLSERDLVGNLCYCRLFVCFCKSTVCTLFPDEQPLSILVPNFK